MNDDILPPALADIMPPPQQGEAPPQAPQQAPTGILPPDLEPARDARDQWVPAEHRDRMEQARQEAVGGESGLEAVARRNVPFVSQYLKHVEKTDRDYAMERIQSGEGKDRDYRTVAEFDTRQDQLAQRRQTWGGAILEGVASLPAIAGEMYVAGPLLRGAGALAGGAARVLGAGRLGTAAAEVVGAASATGPTVPSFGLVEHAQASAREHGGEWTDPANLARAQAITTVNAAILGQVGRLAGSLPGSGIGGTAARLGIAGGAGVLEQAAADVATHAAGLQTGYGTVESLLTPGRREEGLREATVQFLTFAAFAGMHEAQNPRRVMDAFTDTTTALRRAGASPESAARQTAEALDTVTQAMRDNPALTRAEARDAVAELPRPVRELGEAIADTLPKKVEARPESPAEAPAAPPEGSEAPAPETPIEQPVEAPPAAPERQRPFEHLAPAELQQVAEQFLGKTKVKDAAALVRELKRRGTGDEYIERLSEATRQKEVTPEQQEAPPPETTEPPPVADPKRTQSGPKADPQAEPQAGEQVEGVTPVTPEPEAIRPSAEPLSRIERMRQRQGELAQEARPRPSEPVLKEKPDKDLAVSAAEREAEARTNAIRFEHVPEDLRTRSAEVAKALEGVHDSKDVTDSHLAAFAGGGREGLEVLLDMQEARLKPPPRLEAAYDHLDRQMKEFTDEVERAAKAAVREGDSPDVAGRRIQETLHRADETARRGGAGAGERTPLSPEALAEARRRQLAENRGAPTLLSIIKKMGGLSKETARNHGLDVDAIEEIVPTAFKDRKGRKGTLDISQVYGSLLSNGDITASPEGRHAHEWLIEKVLERKRTLEYNADRQLEAEHRAYLQELEDARQAGFSPEAIAKAEAEGREIGEAEGRERPPAESIGEIAGEPRLDDAFGADLDFAFGANESAAPTPEPTPQPNRAANEFGRPLTDAERQGQLGGGQEGAPAGAPKSLTALANAKIDAERAAQKLPPLMSEARKSNAEIWDRAMELLDRDPGLSERLVNELAAKPRATTVEENALLLHRRIAVRNELERAYLDGVRLYRDKDATPEQLALADARVTGLESMRDVIDNVARKTGSEWGRAGQFRRQLAAEDFSLASMMKQAEQAKGRRLTAEETATIADQQKKIADLEAKLAEQEKRGETEPGEASDLGFEIEQAKEQFTKQLVEDRRARAPWTTKALRLVGDAASLPRSLMSAIDFPLLRQGGIAALSHPIRTAKAVPEMLHAFFSETAAKRARYELQHRPNAALYEASGLEITNREGPMSMREEGFLSRLLDRLPGVGHLTRASERSYQTVLNRIRADAFDTMAASLSRNGRLTTSEAQVIANYANVMTGRGPLGKAEAAATFLNHIFFAPKWTVSRFQLLAGQPLWTGLGEGGHRARVEVAKEYARTAAGLGVVLGLAKLAGLQVETDPRSTDAGKVKIGNTRLDFTAGLGNALTFMSRIGTGSKKTQTGAIVSTREGGFGQDDAASLTGRMLRGKLAPAPGLALDLTTGRNVVGQPVTVLPHSATWQAWEQSAVGKATTPLFVKDVVDAMRDLGVPKGTAASLLGLFGMGVQSYDANRPR